jgi:DNA replicative helicase MCM subunit Mcm2 (Cdc46/Mcm family)
MKWSEIRQRDKENLKRLKILPASIRSLESIIRLSYAYAKLRMSKIVQVQDAIKSL